MKHFIKLTSLASIIALSACKSDKNIDSNKNETQENITIAHSLGESNVIKNPKNVVALDFASLETLEELGIEVIGMPKDNLPLHLLRYKEIKTITDLGTLKEIDYEKLNELNPDVIFMSSRLQNEYSEISKIAPTIYTEIDYTNYLKSLEKNFKTYGEIFNKEVEVEEELKAISNKIEKIHQSTQNSDKRALIVLHNNGRFSAYGKGSRFGLIHDVLGVKEAVENLEVARHGQAVSNEFIQEANPDYLFIIDRSAVIDREATNKSAIENKLIQQTNAYKNGKIIYLDAEIWYLSGGGITSINRMIDEVAESLY